jgi:mannitol 2-dehydrogenase
MTRVQLNQGNLSKLKIAVPAYSRKDLKPSWVHIGLGHFHRAHQAAYLDELLNRGLWDGGIFEINLIPDRTPLGADAEAQDYLYTLLTKSAAGEETVRVIGSILGYLNASEKKEAAIKRLASKETECITLTVTEKGYYYNVVKDELAWDQPPVAHDKSHPDKPETVIGCLAAALSLRSKTNKKPITIMSCDNVPSNGERLKKGVLSFCRELYPGLAEWVEEYVAFPGSMVDRITPGTTEEIIRSLEDNYGLADKWPVRCEDFRQWVLEDNFRSPVPPYGEAGVQLVKDVEPYELMKIRLLNGSHSALSYLAYLLGYREVAEAASDPLLRRFIRDLYMEEISATLPAVEGIDLRAYKDTLINRFSNKNIGDSILRLASDGSRKVPNSVLSPLREALNHGGKYRAVALALAGWARFLHGSDEEGREIPLEDFYAPALSEAAKKAPADPEGFLKAIGVHGISEKAMTELAGTFVNYLNQLFRLGTRKTLAGFTAGEGV